MPDSFEGMVKNKLTLSDIRKGVLRQPTLKEELMDSMAQPITYLSKRFMSMKIKEEPVKLSKAAKDEEIQAIFENIHTVYAGVDITKLRKDDLKDKEKLQEFMKNHCYQSPYLFQVKKCLDPTCFYCKEHPVRIPRDQFSLVHFLPLPLLDSSKVKYQTFVYMEQNRQLKISHPQSHHQMKKQQKLTVTTSQF